MGMSWTREQEQVIQLQNRNILVSAAAGSGKTAVLVERILNKMLRKENPVDIDRLLIVTFTRAAAGEMRERLTAAIEKRLQEEPDNEHLQRQQTLIHNAQINTIDGFCSYVIRNYFHTIDLDPGFRTAEEGELKLLKYDVAKDLLEKEYGEATEAFQNFTEVFAAGKTDDNIIDLILKVYEFSMSNPWPKEWLQECAKPYQAETLDDLWGSVWMEKLWMDVLHELEQAESLHQRFRKLAADSDGPYMYEDMAAADGIYLKELRKTVDQKNFDECFALLNNYKFTMLSRKKDDTVSLEKREQAKNLRDEYKAVLNDLKKRYFYGNSCRILEELNLCRGPVEELLRLTADFMDAFAEKKKQKNIVDFSDMEHFALEILVKKQDGQLIYTEAADEFSRRFEEILIDEYQDSNLVQETLLRSVSRLRHGEHNIFMVGDVKQSIYRFRLARPELFMEKYETYSLEDSVCQRIDLHKNFRSRPQVLSSVNFIFQQIMGKDLGGVEYDEAAALYPGASFPDAEKEEFYTTEVLLARKDVAEWNEDGESTSLAEEAADQELEARMIGKRILEMVGREQVLDKETGTYRPVRFRDCVILLRTMTGWSEVFVQVLKDMGIPAYATSRTGYFQTVEVMTLLNYLHICDNPMQEIPFTGVLLSPIGGCTPEELAKIKGEFPKKKLYEAAWKYRTDGLVPEIRKKLDLFLCQYEKIRECVPYTPIHELILLILRATGYGECAAAMPGGGQRSANLEMLVEKAMEFEKTSYRGLFNFIRYMEQLQKYQVDFGEVSLVGENEDTVRIMSIHKSKGLEFPVVFAAGMGKRFNMQDANAGLVIHPDLGIGMYGIEPQLRVKMPTMLRQVMQKQIRLESLGEELRVLYVALTRAKEKLIITGTVDQWEKKLEQYRSVCSGKEEKLPYGILEKAQDFWGWILPALFAQKEEIPFSIQTKSAGDLVFEEMEQQISQEQRYWELTHWDMEKVYDPQLKKQLEEKFSYVYPYGYLQEIPAKLSVSELKNQDLEEEAQPLISEEIMEPVVPDFIRQEKTVLKGAAKGTAYHKVLELLDYEAVDTKEEIEKQLDQMYRAGKIDGQIKESVRISQIHWFAASRLGQRMKKAWEQGKLWREQQFVMSIPASQRNVQWGDQDQILVQGIIDAFFEEEKGLVLVDYKTDYVENGQEQDLIEKYQKQLWYYARVLEQVRGKTVKEVYIYSFALGKSLAVKWDEKEMEAKCFQGMFVNERRIEF